MLQYIELILILYTVQCAAYIIPLANCLNHPEEWDNNDRFVMRFLFPATLLIKLVYWIRDRYTPIKNNHISYWKCTTDRFPYFTCGLNYSFERNGLNSMTARYVCLQNEDFSFYAATMWHYFTTEDKQELRFKRKYNLKHL